MNARATVGGPRLFLTPAWMHFRLVRFEYAILLWIAIALSLTTALYWRGLSGPFLLDDYTNTVLIRLRDLRWQDILETALGNRSGLLGRPISTLSFALNHYFSGLYEFRYKYTNLMVHLITGLSLFWLGGRLLAIRLGAAHSARAWGIAAGAASLWLLHPLQVSTVLYVVQRMAQLSSLFTILALLAFVAGRQRLASGRSLGLPIMLVGVTVFGSLAVFSKENGILIPLFILAIELLFFRLQTAGRVHRNSLFVFLGTFVLLPMIAGLLYLAAHMDSMLAYEARHYSLVQRLMTEAHTLVFYLRLTLLPRLGLMGLYHDDFPLTTVLDFPTILVLGGIAGLLALVALFHKKAPVFAFGIAWFFIAHLLESTVLPLELVFEHRNYLAIYGPLLSVTYYFSHPHAEFRKSLYPRLGFLVLFTVLLGTMTFQRADTWSTNEKLFTTMATDHPDSPRAQVGLAQLRLSRGDRAGALRRLERAAELAPWDPGMPTMMILAMCTSNKIDNYYLDRVKNRIREATLPGSLGHTMLGLMQEHLSGRCPALNTNDLLELTETLLANRELTDKTGARVIHLIHARVLARLNRNTEALAACDRAFESNPKELDALFEKAYLQLNLNMLEGAADTIAKLREVEAHQLRNQRHKIDELEMYLQQAQAARAQ